MWNIPALVLAEVAEERSVCREYVGGARGGRSRTGGGREGPGRSSPHC